MTNKRSAKLFPFHVCNKPSFPFSVNNSVNSNIAYTYWNTLNPHTNMVRYITNFPHFAY